MLTAIIAVLITDVDVTVFNGSVCLVKKETLMINYCHTMKDGVTAHYGEVKEGASNARHTRCKKEQRTT